VYGTLLQGIWMLVSRIRTWWGTDSSEQSVFHKQDGSGDGIPRWPWFVFLTGTMVCLVCSSLSHLLACHSKRYNLFFWRLDYAGISLVIVSSFLAPIYDTFYCNPNPPFFYLTSILVHLTLQGTPIRFFMCLLFKQHFLTLLPH
jgi:adiponectin receptor